MNSWTRSIASRLHAALVLISSHPTPIAIGLLLRLILMPFTVQYDIIIHTWISNFIAQGHIDIYRYYFNTYGTIMYGKMVEIPFPPMSYLFFGAYVFLLKNLHVLNTLDYWKTDMAYNIWLPQQNRLLFFLKAIYIPFDILALIALLGCLDPRDRRLAAYAWMLNPFILYIAYGWGQTDLIVCSFVMVGLYLAKRAITTGETRKSLLSCLSIGVAACFKLFPLILLPIFSIFFSKKLGRKYLYHLAVGLAPLAGSALPFVSGPFLAAMSSNSDYITIIHLQNFYPIFVVPAMYMLIIYHTHLSKIEYTFDRFLAYGLAVFALLFGLGAWYPNWFLWVLPYVLLTVFRKRQLVFVYWALATSYFVLAQGWGNTLGLGLFFPMTDIGPSTGPLSGFPNFSELVPNYPFVIGLANTVMAASMFYLCFHIWSGVGDRPSLSLPEITVPSLFPIFLGGFIFFSGLAYIRAHPSSLFSTLFLKVNSDPLFFGLYGILLAAVCVWLISTKVRFR